MNLALSDEQVLLREAARGALSRVKTLAAAREALDGDASALPDLWPTACEAGWPGLLIDEAHGGAGLDAFDAMLVLGECGRVLASHALLGHLPATAILNDSPAGTPLLEALASGERRAAYLPVRPPDELTASWTADPREGMQRPPAPAATRPSAPTATGASVPAATDAPQPAATDAPQPAATDAPQRTATDAPQRTATDAHASLSEVQVSGELAFVPDAPGADVYVGAAMLDGGPVGVAIEASATGVAVEPVSRYDATRSLGHVSLREAPATLLDANEQALAGAWHLAQALIAAESLGSVESALDLSVAYAKERHTFGRAIGSYQAVKHSLTEVLRQLENGRSLLYYAGWSRKGAPDEFPLAANAARSVAGNALDYAARAMISVHGGIGATWEHDAPLYFRRAQLSRRLLGGTAGASDRVAGELIAQAQAA
jgi:alkylation response protein AidB-like acyl-CoA dehydrogenase